MPLVANTDLPTFERLRTGRLTSHSEDCTNRLDRSLVRGENLRRVDSAVRGNAQAICECAAPIDPELPFLRRHGHLDPIHHGLFRCEDEIDTDRV